MDRRGRNRLRRFAERPRFWVLLLLALGLWSVSAPAGAGAGAGVFTPEQPVLPPAGLRPGAKGHLLTVLKGTKPVKLPLEIVSVVPGKEQPKNSILIRMLPSPENRTGGLAQGMSGSPVFVGGKLVGAVGVGWNFSDHTMALVTPIGEMCAVFSRPDRQIGLKGLPDTGGAQEKNTKEKDAQERNAKEKNAKEKSTALFRSSPLMVGGLSGGAVSRLAEVLDVPLEAVPYGAGGDLLVEDVPFAPGEAVSVLLAWGDVEMAATGTVTATSRDGRFLAFGHSFLERGAVNFPAARAYVHDVVGSRLFPFKVASPVALTGTVTQDRAAGIGGRGGYFTPSIAATLVFRDADAGRDARAVKNFRVVPDAFLGAKLLEGVYGGLLDDQWGRKGQGTATVTLRVEGRGLLPGWTRTNVFFSDSEIGGEALRESSSIMEMFLLQPFREVFPIGFRLDVSMTQEPRVLAIEDVVVSSDARPGGTLDVEVTLRPWRRGPVKKHFEVVVPKEAEGTCELVVRGGGTNSLSQLAVDGGWKSIDSFERLLTEMDAADANNELIVELLWQAGDRTPQSGKKGKDGKTRPTPTLLPEEKEFLSETKTRRIKEGTLRISRSDHVVEGLMRRLIDVDGTEQ
ncbi:MAG: hypothetical protein LBO82_01480 [Synergistaceae bacterium]|jgi:hypothetical protein|nr:hypothetical protein [Synergistaceae bacterium]